MRILSCVIVLLVLLSVSAFATDEIDAQGYVEKARSLADSGDLAGAVTLLEEGSTRYPEDSDIHAFLGLYTGMSAGRATDYMEAGKLSMMSFQILGRAIELDTENPRAYLFRGIMGVNVPEFLGKLPGGIVDLEKAVELYSASPSETSAEERITAMTMLAEGYGKKQDLPMQRQTLEKIIEMAPGSEAASDAEKKLSTLTVSDEKPDEDASIIAPDDADSEDVAAIKKALEEKPGDAALLFKLGKTYYDDGAFEEARLALRRYVEMDPDNSDAYVMLALSVSNMAGAGYNEDVYSDTDHRSKQAFESMNYLDKAVEISPGDMQLRLIRGTFGILFPFFLGKHQQGVEDLSLVAGSDAPDSVKAEAIYYLGVSSQREAMRYWIRVASEFPESEAARMVYEQMRPDIPVFDPAAVKKPFVKIDFLLGFQDELPPQTAIWIENVKGEYVATVYVSGFAGFVKENQVTLPEWAGASGFESIDGVTGASIDVGHHIYVWDLVDFKGKKVKDGTYVIRIETSFWPSGKYQIAESTIEVGKKSNATKVEKGDFIPYLEVEYFND